MMMGSPKEPVILFNTHINYFLYSINVFFYSGWVKNPYKLKKKLCL